MQGRIPFWILKKYVLLFLWTRNLYYHFNILLILCTDFLGEPKINTCRLGWQPKSRSVLTTCKWPLLTAMCNGVCLRLFLAFKSAPPLCSTSMTEPSSPNAAWCTARSPSLSWTTTCGCQTWRNYQNRTDACEWGAKSDQTQPQIPGPRCVWAAASGHPRDRSDWLLA